MGNIAKLLIVLVVGAIMVYGWRYHHPFINIALFVLIVVVGFFRVAFLKKNQ
jgi:uncharacterized membrane protein